ncbi:MAG: hypothetical protein QGG64_15650, partial [Candidatus Latescibacteria bacterium]|nr:hypothetical protein [Candidatus Latescibacterota bacterium]
MFQQAFFSRFYLRPLLVGVLGLVLVGGVVDAKTKRMDKTIVKTAEALAKDREAFFAGEDAMPVTDFQAKWTEFASVLDSEYHEHTIKLKTFGADVKVRKVFTHLMY